MSPQWVRGMHTKGRKTKNSNGNLSSKGPRDGKLLLAQDNFSLNGHVSSILDKAWEQNSPFVRDVLPGK